MNKYKHTPDTLEKARYYLGHDVRLITFSILCAFIAVYAIILGSISFIKNGDIFALIGAVLLSSVALTFLIIFAKKIRKRHMLLKEVAKADVEENEFLKINCRAISYIRVYMHRYSHNNGKVQGFYLLAEDGKEYVYILEDLIVVPFSEEIAFENKELTGTLYIRRYKGTNQLCEIKKEI